jgi:hypothetical protein
VGLLARLVSLVGLSPGSPHTALCLLRGEGYPIDEVVLVGNVAGVVEEAARILRECPCPSGPPPAIGARVSSRLLGFPDIRGQADLAELASTLRGLLGRGDVVDITGGRKVAAAWSAIVALSVGARVAATIVPRGEAERALRAASPCGKTVRGARLVWLA